MKKVLLRTICSISFLTVLLSTASINANPVFADVNDAGLHVKNVSDATRYVPVHKVVAGTNNIASSVARNNQIKVGPVMEMQKTTVLNASDRPFGNLQDVSAKAQIPFTPLFGCPINSYQKTGPGVYQFVVPVGVTELTITGVGAAGGNDLANEPNTVGGRGASLKGKFAVTPGETLYLLVGGKGGDNADALGAGGGGGGTFVTRSASFANNLLMAAGGGGGAGENETTLKDANVGPDGNDGLNASFVTGSLWVNGGDGGFNGSGGSGGEAGGSGAGWLRDGENDILSTSYLYGSVYNTAGISPRNSYTSIANVPEYSYGGIGGFGGGGSAALGGGGGGGYSGGGGGAYRGDITSETDPGRGYSGGGGGSYNGGIPGSVQNTPGVGTGNGSVTIEWTTPTPTISVTAGSTTFCQGGSATLTASSLGTSSTYLWSNGATSQSIVVTAGGSYTVTVGAPDICSASSAPVTITVNSLPNISVNPSSSSINAGGSVQLTASGGSTYSWSPAAGLGVTTGNVVMASPSATTTYTVTGTSNGCSNTATATVTVTAAPSNPATALNFDGVDDKVTVNNTTLGNFGTGDFTVEMSVRTTLSNGVQYLASKRSFCGADNFFSLQIVNGRLNMEMQQNLSTPTYYVALIGHTFISDGQWHHVALTRQLGNVNIYVDGVLETTSNATIANINNNYALEFGSSVCNGQNGSVKFVGDMDEIRIWSRALCTEELDHYRHCELSLAQTGLQAYYKLNAGFLNANNAGITTAVDATGNGNSATLTNFGLTGTSSNWVAGTASGTCTPFVSGAASITGNNPVCIGATVQLSASPSGGTWVSSNAAIASVNGSGLVTGNAAGSATITYTSLCGAVATVSVTVNENITPTFTQVADICSGTTLSTLPTTSNNGITGTWSPALNNTATTTYTFTPSAGQCATTATMTIAVIPNNTIVLTSAAGTDAQSTCINTAGTNITYATTGATGATFSGLPSGVTGSWLANAVTISGTPTIAGTYNYTVNLLGGCGTVTASGTITVKAVNTSTLSSGAGSNVQTACTNVPISNITYTTTGATGISSSGLPAGVAASFAANTITVSGTPTAAGTFNYSVTTVGGCGVATVTGTITVRLNNVQPTAVSANTNSICPGNTVVLTQSGGSLGTGASWKWYSDAAYTTLVGTSTLANAALSVTPSVTTTYYLRVEGVGNPCAPAILAAPGSVTVTVGSAAVAPTAPNVVNCSNGIVNLTATGGSTSNYLWFDAATGGKLLATTATLTTPVLTQTTSYYVEDYTASNETGLNAATTSNQFCSVASGNSASAFDITNTSGNNLLITAVSTSFNTTNATQPIQVYYRTSTYSGNDANAAGWVLVFNGNINVSASRTPIKINLTTPVYLPAGSKYGFYVYSPGIAQRQLLGANTYAGSDITITTGDLICSASGPFGGGVNTGFSLFGAAYYKNLSCESPRTTSQAIIATPNTISLSSASGTNAQTICLNAPVSNITYATTGATGATVTGLPAGVTGTWSANVVTISGTPTASGTFNYTVTTTGGSCTQPVATGTITVNVLPAIVVSPSAPIINSGGNVGLTASGASSYTWSPATGLNTTSGANLTANPASSITYTVTGTDANSCVNTTTVTVKVNATALNFDGIDDYVVSTGLTTTTTTKTLSAWVKLNNVSQGGGGLVSLETSNGGVFDAIVYNETGQGWGFGSDGFGRTVWSGVLETNTNTWVHIAATYSANDYKLYRNGVLILQTTAFGINSFPASSRILIGKRHTGGSNPFLNASIDEVTVWNRALCQAEIQNNMNCELNPTGQTGLVALYHLNNGFINFNNSSANTTTDAGSNNLTGTLNNFTLNGTASNWVAGTVSGNCSVFTDVVAPITGTMNVCVGATTQLADATTGGKWSTNNAGVASVNSTGLVTGNAQGTATITYTSGCGTSVTTVVTVNAKPTVTANNAGAGCAGDKIELFSSPGSSYSWTGPNGFSSTQQNPEIASSILANAGTYTVTVTNAAGCSASASTTVTVNTLPVITAGGNSPVCEGGTINLNSGGGVSYIWNGPGGFSSTDQNPVINNATPAQSGTYFVKGTGVNGCRNTASVNVVVNATPAAPTGTNGSVCVPNGVTISANGANGETIKWYANATGGNALSVGNNFYTNVAGTFYAEAESAAGCVSATRTAVTATITPLPTITGASNICINGTTILTGSGTPALSNAWVSSNPSVASVDNTGVVTAHNTGNVTITYTNNGGCTATTNIFVSGLPGVGILPNGSVSICAGGSVTLNSNSEEGLTYSWNIPGGSTASSITVNAAGTYTLTGTNSLGCSNNASVTVIVNALPNAPTGTNASACAPSGVTISANGASGETIKWYANATGGLPISVGNNFNTNISGTFYAEAVSASGCVSATRTAVTASINPRPVTYAVSGGGAYCSGGPGVSVNLSGSELGVNYTLYLNGSPTGTTLAGTGSGISFTNVTVAGNYSISAANPATTCSASMNGSVTVSINPLPVITSINGTNVICSGTTATLTASYTNGNLPVVTWYDAPTGGNLVFTGNPFTTPALTANTTYYASVSNNGNGCVSASRASIAVTVNPIPTVSGVSGSTTICVGSTTTLTASSGASSPIFKWYTSAIGGSLLFTGASYSSSYITTTTVYVEVTSNTCVSASRFPVTVSVSAQPTVTAASNSPLCSDGTVTLFATGSAASFSWSGPNGFTSNQQNPTIANATASATGTYTVVAAAPGCSNATANTIVTVTQTPSIPVVSGPAIICAGTSTTITASTSAGASIVWYDAASGGSIVGTGTSFVVTPGSTTTYYAQGSTVGGAGVIVNTLAANATTAVEVVSQTGDDRGAIAVTQNAVFINGDGGIGRFDHNLNVQASLLPQRDGMFCDINPSTSGQLWSLWNNSASVATGNSTQVVDAIRSMDQNMVYGSITMLSTPITLGYNAGIFSGSGYVLLYSATNNAWYAVNLSSGVVTSLGNVGGASLNAYVTENWARWGWAEYNGTSYFAVYRDASSQNIVKRNISTGVVTTLASYTTLSDMANIIYSPWDNRAYMHHEGTAQFRSGDESLEYVAGTSTTTGAITCNSTARSAVTVTVIDLPVATIATTDPTSGCPGTIVNLTANTGSGYTYQWLRNGLNIGGPTSSNTYAAASSGTYTVKITNSNGCVSAVSNAINISIQDATPPVTPILPVITAQCSVTVPYPTTTDNCAGTITATTSDPRTYSSEGTYIIHWIFNDGNGNSITANQQVIIDDNIAPTITCPSTMTRIAGSTISGYGAIVNYDPATATDNCGSVTVSYSPASGSFFTPGTHQVTATANDGRGNTTSCTFNVIVYAPEINITGNGLSITDGDITPQAADGTHFGSTLPGVPVTRTFTIQNTGDENLTVSSINIGGVNASNFTLSNFAPGVVEAGASITFDVTFQSNTIGTKNAVVTVNNDDYDESSYDFAISAEINCVPPSFTVCANNITTHTDAGLCSAIVNYTVTAAGIPTPALTYTFTGATTGTGSGDGSGKAFNKGTTTVTITANSSCGTAQCSFTITVNDEEKPVITSVEPAVITLANDAGICGAAANWTVPVATDNCPGVTMTSNYEPGHVFPVGTTTVTYTATDASGNTATLSFNIVVTDDEDPIITVPASITHAANEGSCSYNFAGAPVAVAPAGDPDKNTPASSVPSSAVPVSSPAAPPASAPSYGSSASLATVIGTATASDNCSIVQLVGVRSDDQPLTAAYPVGVTTIVWTATDASGHTVSGTQTITIVDEEKPTITAPGAVTVSADAGSCAATNVVLGTPVTADNCGVQPTTNNAPASFPIGATTVTWTVTDIHGNSSEATQIVTVVDDQKPTFTCPGNISVYAEAGQNGGAIISSFAVTDAADNCGTPSVSYSINPGTFFAVGVWPVTITVTDAGGNQVSCTITVTVLNNAPVAKPDIHTIPEDTQATGNVLGNDTDMDGDALIVTGFEIGGTPYAKGTPIVIPGVGVLILSTNGDYIFTPAPDFNGSVPVITYTISDGKGGTASSTLTINVTPVDDITVVKTKDITVYVDATGHVSITTGQIDDGSYDSDGIASITLDKTNFTCSDLGPNTVVLTVTDVDGHSASATATVTVLDIIAPSIICPAPVTVQCASAVPAANTALVTTSDNCSSVVTFVGDVISNQTAPNKYTITRTYKATDPSGNSTSCTQIITVNDNTKPVLAGILPGNATGQCLSGVPAAPSTASIAALYTDNCSGALTAVLANTTTIGDNASGWTRKYFYNVTDVSGNTTVACVTYTGKDNVAPVLAGVLPGATGLQCLAGVPAAPSVSTIAGLYSDNCGTPAAVLTGTVTTGNNASGWTVKYNYTINDGNGNSTTACVTYSGKDNVPPAIVCPANITIACGLTTIPANTGGTATATDNCGGSVTVTYSDVVNGNVTTRTWKATDAVGNFSTCTQTITQNGPFVTNVVSVPTNNVYTGGGANTLFIGYGAQSSTLTTSVPSGSTYTYVWSGADVAMLNSTTSANPVFTPTRGGNFTFNVTVTNALGCVSTASISICVTDVRVFAGNSGTCSHQSHSSNNCPHKDHDHSCNHTSHGSYNCPDNDDHDDHQGMCNHQSHNSDECPHKGHNHSCDHRSHSSYSCSHRGTNDRDDDDDNEKTCDHKSHSSSDCSHKGHGHANCNHSSHSASNCPHGKSSGSSNDTKVCDHKSHSSNDCNHNGHNHGTCNHKSHTAAACPHNGGTGGTDDDDDDAKKVYICHVPPGNPGKRLTLSISVNAVAAHLENHPGDRLGSCEQAPCSGYTDNVKPVIDCSDNVTIAYGASTSPATTGAPEADDNSGDVNITYTDVSTKGTNPASANYYNYTITRTWKAADLAGNYVTCVQVITVQDVTKPVISCPSGITVSCGSTAPSVTGTATATDNSGAVTISPTDATNGDYITRTWKATDPSGNYATCTQTIKVVDNVKPVLTAPNDITIECGSSTLPAATGNASATDNCSSVTLTYSDATSGNKITRTWKAKDASGNYITDVQVITIVDNTKPTITAPADITISCNASTAPKYCGGSATGSDNCSNVTITYNDMTGGNTITRTWKATDESGNYSTGVQLITLVDNTKPVITDASDITISCGASTDPSNCGGTPKATDNCGTPTVTYLDAVNGNKITRVWTATDGAGNTASSTQIITIVDNTKPVISDVADKIVNCGASTDPSATGTPTATDNCSSVTITKTDVTSGNVITRTWKATDASGNYSTSTQTITIGLAFTATVSSVPTVSTYTGGVSTNLYLGYGAQSTALQVCALPSAGAPYTYSWSGGYTDKLNSTTSAAPVFTPSTFGYYTFSVMVTNKYGCTSTATISICVTDVRVPGTNGTKVYICHKTSGKYGTTQTLQVAINQVSSHLGSNSCGSDGNDRLGSCDQSPCNTTVTNSSVTSNTSGATKEGGSEVVTTSEELKVTAMPNPSTTFFTLKLESKYETPVTMRVMDANGRVVDARSKIGANSTIQIGHNYSSGTYYAELIQGATRKVIQLIKGRG